MTVYEYINLLQQDVLTITFVIVATDDNFGEARDLCICIENESLAISLQSANKDAANEKVMRIKF